MNQTLWVRLLARTLLGALALFAATPHRLAAPIPPTRPPGELFVLSAPSGTGKSTVAREVLQRVPELVFGVSHTTREPRPGERDGVDYVFVSEAAFDRMLAEGRFLEWDAIYGHRYGLGRAWVQEQLRAGRDVLLDLDTRGTRMLRHNLPGALTVFLLPPSASELAARLRGRRSETEAQVALRLDQARRELEHCHEYKYVIVNQTVAQAAVELEAIIVARRARQERRQALAQKIIEGF
jgi:guanylate kinase